MKKTVLLIITIAKVLILALVDFLCCLVCKDKNAVFWVMFSIFNVLYLLTYLDLIRIISSISKDRDNYFLVQPQSYCLFVFNIIILVVMFVFSITYKFTLQNFTYVIIATLVILIAITIVLGWLFVDNKYINQHENKVRQDRFFKNAILSRIIVLSKTNPGCEKEFKKLIEYIMYDMIIESNEAVAKYENNILHIISLMENITDDEEMLANIKNLYSLLESRNMLLKNN